MSISGDTPFARGSLATDIGVDGQGDKVEEMLKGTYVLDVKEMDDVHASSELQCFMKALQVPKSKIHGEKVPLMNSEVNLDHYIGVFNRTDESTASSPSGIHYGHYKAAVESETLAKVDMIFMTIPFVVGTPPNKVGTESSLYDSKSE